MLSERSINKIGKHLENEGWTDEEIAEAIEQLEGSKGVKNIVLPLHFKEEALHHAKCHCKYVLKLNEGSKKYKSAFEDAYSTYLIEAYENSRGVEGPESGSHKRSNPAGIEVFAFDGIGSGFIPKEEKESVAEKAPIGLLLMGKDSMLQESIKKMYDRIKDPDTTKHIVTQYSAAVVSLANTFLYGFGGYKPKRKFAGKRIYKVNQESRSLEFNAKSGDKEFDRLGTLGVSYRQITRQIYIIIMNKIISSTMGMDQSLVEKIEEGVSRRAAELWKIHIKNEIEKGMRAQPPLSQEKLARIANKRINLPFLLSRSVREQIVKSFLMGIKGVGNEARKTYIIKIQDAVKNWAEKDENPNNKID
jgi:hypothetical protein